MTTINKTSLWKTTLFVILILTFISKANAQYYPDEEMDTIGFDVEIISDGLDTVFYLDNMSYIDSIALRTAYYFGNLHDYQNYAAKIGVLDSDIHVNIGHTIKAVNKGLLGYHLGDIFDKATIPNDSSSTDQ